jgi:hypothetical protein
MTTHYTDLKLIDELLCDLRERMRDRRCIDPVSWEDVENDTSITRAAMARLRAAWKSGEMELITLSLAKYFDGG